LKESLDFIYKQQKELSVFSGIGALLGWDQMTYMPKKGASRRSEQSSLISTLFHRRVVSDEFWKHINVLADNLEDLSEKDKIVVKKLRKDVAKSRKIPEDFVTRMSKATTIAYQKWEKARNKKDFKVFSPDLEKIIDLEKEYCSYMDLPGPRYDTLLDDYEEGMTAEKLKKEFYPLKKELVKILDKIKDSSIYSNQVKLDKKFSKDQQKKLCDLVIEKMLLPKDQSRVDETTHPFTTSIGNQDVRITTNFDREDPLFSFTSTVHEAGHALYELGMPKGEYEYTVISDSPSLGIHESQSRFWENMIAKSKSFWKYFYPKFVNAAPGQFENTSFDSWFKLVNRVEPSLIRVEADELTYCLHVILRFEIELGLMDESISVSELPQVWNQKMDEMLGVKPSNDVEGVLQDMHWSGGAIGYFPTYAIGSIYSAQLFKTLSKQKPDVYKDIEKAEFADILSWLREKVHVHGRKYMADDIIKKVCGEGLNSKVFVDYLKDKYYDLYKV
jgi:carboxypeptidase Taq